MRVFCFVGILLLALACIVAGTEEVEQKQLTEQQIKSNTNSKGHEELTKTAGQGTASDVSNGQQPVVDLQKAAKSQYTPPNEKHVDHGQRKKDKKYRQQQRQHQARMQVQHQGKRRRNNQNNNNNMSSNVHAEPTGQKTNHKKSQIKQKGRQEHSNRNDEKLRKKLEATKQKQHAILSTVPGSVDSTTFTDIGRRSNRDKHRSVGGNKHQRKTHSHESTHHNQQQSQPQLQQTQPQKNEEQLQPKKEQQQPLHVPQEQDGLEQKIQSRRNTRRNTQTKKAKLNHD